MNRNKKCISTIVIFLSLAISLFANKPHVINIYKNSYNAANKNWDIDQDERGFMYFANDIGLLQFDGIEWSLNTLPGSMIIRSVAALSHKTIFTGSYDEFGRWDRDISGKLVYTSLSKDLDKTLFKNDDFWKIWIKEDKVYFQSFTSIYIYDYNTVIRIPVDFPFLFLNKVREEFLVQEMLGPIYRLKDNNLELIKGSEIFSNTDVRVILPYKKDQYLIGTSTKGIYIYDGLHFKEWNTELSKKLSVEELNCGIQTSDGNYYFGTILNGIYTTDSKGNILDNISTKGALQNNTILSLYEDKLKNVWVAMDRGISYIQHLDDMSCFSDELGRIGAVYDAISWDDKLFIGTNQGVYTIPLNNLYVANLFSKINLIEGTQGQVWSLRIIDDKLYCGHNKGLKQIHKNLSVTDEYNLSTGVYDITKSEFKGQVLFLISTYSGLKLINKTTNNSTQSKQISEPITNTIVDHLGNVWLEHFMKGVYRCRLNNEGNSFSEIMYYSRETNENLPSKMRIFKLGGRSMFIGDDFFFLYDEVNDQITPDKLLNDCFKNVKDIKQIVTEKESIYWALTNTAIYRFFYDGYRASVISRYNIGSNLSLVNNYENISVLNDSTNLICLDNGFLIHYDKKELIKSDGLTPTAAPYIESVETFDSKKNQAYIDIKTQNEISYELNSITISFSSEKVYPLDLQFQHMIESVDGEWSTPHKMNKVTYERLPEGTYTFKLRTIDNFGNPSEEASFTFIILPPWYQTWWAYLSYALIIIAVLYIIWLLILRRYRNIHLQKIRSREAKRLRALTEKLSREIEHKNAELLTQTSFIIQKNELLMKLQETVNDFYQKTSNKSILPLQEKINTVLRGVDTEEDWKMFLIKFEQKHTNFFKNIKSKYPQLTSQDLRLCACIKLNLDIKETASLMNLSVRAIENSRYRLRKKLDLKPSDNLYDFIISIE